MNKFGSANRVQSVEEMIKLLACGNLKGIEWRCPWRYEWGA
jgi:hypothetical protein